MSLATLANIPALDAMSSFDQFSFSNMDQHRNAIFAIQNQRNIELPIYVLDPIPGFDFEGWLRTHQQSHNDINAVLGVAGSDLTSVDFQDQGQAADWTRLHLSEHQQWAQILRLS